MTPARAAVALAVALASAGSYYARSVAGAVSVTGTSRPHQGPSQAIPDTLWCPMHPNVRSPMPGSCPVCGMHLVPIPPPRVGPYRLDVTHAPAARGARGRVFHFRVRDRVSNTIVDSFMAVHERLLHLFVISRDLRFFAHEHPVRTADGFELSLDLPAGAYMLIADFMPSGGLPQMIHHAVITPGYSRSPFTPAVELAEDLSDKVIEELVVRFSAEGLAVGKEAALRFVLSEASTGAAIRDIQPYLGSSGHLLLVNSDLTQAVHAHPEGGTTAGPELTFGAVIPAPGAYKLWIQVQRAGKVLTAPFVVRVG